MGTVTNFFLGANSGEGFQSLFSRAAERPELYDVMILKGGPGVGKSTFLKALGGAMERAGAAVEYEWCSADPSSLDGVLLPELGCAALDGTAPHVLEPQYPAAVDRIVDLGRFYDLTAAKERRPEIVAGFQSSRAAALRAVHRLKAARQVELDTTAAVERTFDRARAARRIDGVVSRELRRRGGEAGDTAWRYLGGVTCRGNLWRFDSVDALCPKVYELADCYGLAAESLDRIRREAVERGWNVIACLHPEDQTRIEHLLIPGLGLAFVTSRPGMDYGKKPYRRIHMDAMAAPENRARIRFETRMTALLRQEAAEALGEAKADRDALEGVYHPYVDFDGVLRQADMEAARWLTYWKPGGKV